MPDDQAIPAEFPTLEALQAFKAHWESQGQQLIYQEWLDFVQYWSMFGGHGQAPQVPNFVSPSVLVAVPESGEGSKGGQTLILSKMVKEAHQLRCSTFEGTSDAIVAKQWQKKVVAIFDDMSLVDDLKLKVAIRLLGKRASVWWENLRSRAPTQLTWTDFLKVFDEKYYTYYHWNQKRQESMNLTQGSRFVVEYETELKDLAAFVP